MNSPPMRVAANAAQRRRSPPRRRPRTAGIGSRRRAAAGTTRLAPRMNKFSCLGDPAGHEDRDGGRHEGHREDALRRSSAISTVSAIGVNILPSTPVKREDRQVDDRDDQRAEQARLDHFAGSCDDRLAGAPQRQAGRPSRRCRSASRRRQFSTMMTAPSTMMPKSIAPRLIRLALTLRLHHAGDGKQHRQRNDAGGDDRGTDVAEDQKQHGDDQQRAFEQVLLDGRDGGFDQVGAVVDRPRDDALRERLRRSSSSLAATRCATARLFSPISSMAVPSTVSLPSNVAAPVRRSLPSRTSATSRTRTGMPPREPMTMSRISSTFAT